MSLLEQSATDVNLDFMPFQHAERVVVILQERSRTYATGMPFANVQKVENVRARYQCNATLPFHSNYGNSFSLLSRVLLRLSSFRRKM